MANHREVFYASPMGIVRELDTSFTNDIKAPIYPSNWFETNPGCKPVISFYEGMNIERSYSLVHGLMSAGEWNDIAVCTFLARTILSREDIFTETLNEDWSSFGREIGLRGQEITPLECLTMVNEENAPEVAAIVPSDNDLRIGLFASLIGAYRRIRVKEANTRQSIDLAAMMEIQLSGPPFHIKPTHLQLVNGILTNRSLTVGYCRMVSAVDMFYIKFPKSPASLICFGTLTAWLHGCTAITSMTHACNVLGLDGTQFAQLLLHTHILEDGLKAFKRGEETGIGHSYFPYHLSMSLTPSSPFTMMTCPTLTYYARALASFGGSPNAPKTYMPNNARSLARVTELAFCVAQKIGKLGGVEVCKSPSTAARETFLNAMFVETLDGPPAAGPDQDADGAAFIRQDQRYIGLPNLMKLAFDICAKFQTGHFGLDDAERLEMKRKARTFKDNMAGTVGAYLYDIYGK